MGRGVLGIVFDTKSRIAPQGREFAKSREWTKVDTKSYLSYKKIISSKAHKGKALHPCYPQGWNGSGMAWAVAQVCGWVGCGWVGEVRVVERERERERKREESE